MENGIDFNEYIGKQVKLLIKDPASPYPNNKQGTFKGYNESHILLLESKNNSDIAVLRDTVLRIEVIR